jgi:hypothetical protein
MTFRDQRTVTTRPASPHGKNADVLVRVCEFQGPTGKVLVNEDSVPPDAKVLRSVETLVSFGTPSYCTFGQADRRAELGLLIVRESGGGNMCRVDYQYAYHSATDQLSQTTNLMLPLGARRVVMGCTNGYIVTMELEPVGKSPAAPSTRP